MKRAGEDAGPEGKEQAVVALRDNRDRRLTLVLTQNYTDWALTGITSERVAELTCTNAATTRMLSAELMFMDSDGRQGYIWMKALRMMEYLTRAEQNMELPLVVRMSELWWEIATAAQIFRRLNIVEPLAMRRVRIERTRTLVIGRIQEPGTRRLTDVLDGDYPRYSAVLATWLRMYTLGMLFLQRHAGVLLFPASQSTLHLRVVAPIPDAYISYAVPGGGDTVREWVVPLGEVGGYMPVLRPWQYFTKRGGHIREHGIEDNSTMDLEPTRDYLVKRALSVSRMESQNDRDAEGVSEYGHAEHVIQHDFSALSLVLLRYLANMDLRPPQDAIDMLVWMLPPQQGVVNFLSAVAPRAAWQAQLGARWLRLLNALHTPGDSWAPAVRDALGGYTANPLHPKYYRTMDEITDPANGNNPLFRGLRSAEVGELDRLYTWK